MSIKFETLLTDIHVIRGLVNVYIIETRDGLALFDTGFPGNETKIFEALGRLGRPVEDLRHIILSHAHPDHMGCAAAIKHATGATVWAHSVDAPLIKAGTPIRKGMIASPGLRNYLLTTMFKRLQPKVQPVEVDELVADGDQLPFLEGFTAIHVPGHSAGQLAYHWSRDRGILFPADSFINRKGPVLPLATEDPHLAKASLKRLKTFEFDAIMFMHGPPVVSGGGEFFRQAEFFR